MSRRISLDGRVKGVDMSNGEKTAVYLLCYHSQKPASLVGSERQFRVVESAISDGLWPYDNGDDPSFFVAKKGGPLTWGVCRPDVRNSIPVGSIAAFFSYTPMEGNNVLYRLCAVTTVLSKQDVMALHRDERFTGFRNLYINALIRPAKGGWQYDESDRAKRHRHPNWLWRIAEYGAMSPKQFEKKFAQVYWEECFPDDLLKSGGLRLAENYVLFSTTAEDSYICKNPPEVALAFKGENEAWSNKPLESLTVRTSAEYGGRGYLRAANASGYVHRHICFEMPTTTALAWRGKLIRALKAADKNVKSRHLTNRLGGAAKCS